MNLKEMLQKITQLREEIAAKFAAHTVEKDGAKTYNFSDSDLIEINKRNDELNKLSEEYEKAYELAKIDEQNQTHLKSLKQVDRPKFSGDPDGEGAQQKGKVLSFGDQFVKQMMKDGKVARNQAVMIDYDAKTLFQTSAGWDPEWVRNGRVELTAERQLMVADLLASGSTNSDTVAWMEETTKTNNAAEAAEGGTYAESAFALTERTTPISKIATWIPVTEEQLADEAQVASYLNMRLQRLIMERLDSQLLVGSGTPPDLKGFLNESIQSQAKGADDVMSAIFKGITKVRYTGYAEPDAIVFHPNDFQDIILTKDADGRFIWGNPTDAQLARMWGYRVVVTPAETENTALIGAFRAYSQLVIRSGIEVEVSNSHDTYFIAGKLAIRAKIRVGKPCYRPYAFCKVTGI